MLRVRHEQHVVLLVVIGVVEQDVEHHPAEQLVHLRDVAVALDHAAPPEQLRELRITEPLAGRAQRNGRG